MSSSYPTNKYTNAKFWCTYCRTFIQDNKACRSKHDASDKHKENVLKHVNRSKREKQQELGGTVQSAPKRPPPVFAPGARVVSIPTQYVTTSSMFSNHSHYWQHNLSGESLEDYIRAADEQDRLEEERLLRAATTANSQAENPSDNSSKTEESMIGQWQVVETKEHNPYYYEETEDTETNNNSNKEEDNFTTKGQSSSVTGSGEETNHNNKYKEDSESDSEKEVDTKEMKPFQNSSYAQEANSSESVTFVKRKQNSNAQKKSFRRKTE